MTFLWINPCASQVLKRAGCFLRQLALPFLDAVKWTKAATHSGIFLLLRISEIVTVLLLTKNTEFMSYCDELAEIFMLFNAGVSTNIVDFYMNICYAMSVSYTHLTLPTNSLV